MDFITTPGSPAATSYVTVAEAKDYLNKRALYDASDWEILSVSQKEQRLMLGTLALQEFSFRGAKACRDQALEFPRWRITDDEYPSKSDTYLTEQDIIDAGYVLPSIPNEIKFAQIEMSYQVAHKMIATMTPGESADRSIDSLFIGNALSVSFSSKKNEKLAEWDRLKMSSLTTVRLYLNSWIRRITGGVV